MIAPIDILNMLYNAPEDKVIEFLQNKHPHFNPEFIQESVSRVAFVREEYAEELQKGVPFSLMFTAHFYGTRVSGLDEKKRPPMLKRAKNLSKAMFRFVVNGMPLETREEASRKLKICEKNECGFFDGSVCTHTECGCFSRIKTFFETESCPIGMW